MAAIQPDPTDPRTFQVVDFAVPQRTSDWMRTLVLALAYVATARPLATSTLYTAEPGTGTVAATLIPITPLVGDTVASGELDDLSAMPGWVVLHPAGIVDTPDLDEPDGLPLATGSLLLPGLPEIGLDHRAAWAAVDTTGQVAHMRYTGHATGSENVDLALLTALFAR